MAKKPWYPFYWADYAGDTAHLSMVEHGAYKLLMQHYYLKGAPLPANAELLYRVCRCTNDAERAAVRAILGEFFLLDGDSYRHPRIDLELEKSRDISEKRRNAANSRHAIADAIADAKAPAIRIQKDTQSQSQVKDIPPLPPVPSVGGLNIKAWNEYIAHRKQIRAKPLKPVSIEKQQRWLVEQGPPEIQQQIVDQTIRNNWQGLFELKTGNSNGAPHQQTRGQSVEDELRDIARKSIKARTAAGSDGGDPGDVQPALPAQVGLRR